MAENPQNPQNTQNNAAISSLKQGNPEDAAKLLHNVAEELYGKNLDLYREQTRLSEILAKITEVIIGIDQDYKITIFNPSAEKVFSLEQKNVIGKNIDDVVKIYKAATPELVKSKDYAFLVQGQSYDHVSIIVDGEGNTKEDEIDRLYFNLKSSYVEYKDKNKEAVIVLSDITHEIELDKQKDEFISIASHELKTPMSVVRNNLWMLQNTSKKKYSQRDIKFMTEMEYGLKRLQGLVTNLLSISKIQQGRLTFDIQKVDIYKVTITSISALEQNAKKKGLTVHIPDKIEANVEVDEAKYQEILDNLLSNAIKYTPKGNITVSIQPDSGAKFYKISVTDEGPGIAHKDYPKIFTKFGRAEEGLKIKTSEGSTGLGLYISKQFILQMGGDVGFSSQLGKGSIFWFTVPVKSPLVTSTDQIQKPMGTITK